MQRKMSATDARIHFGELMRHVVEKKGTVIVEHGGKPHVVVISMERYERLLTAQQERQDWRELVRQARKQVRTELGDRELAPPEEILRETREKRDEQLDALR